MLSLMLPAKYFFSPALLTVPNAGLSSNTEKRFWVGKRFLNCFVSDATVAFA